MRCGLTFRLARTHPARARSSGSETLSRSRSLVGYTIDTHESEVFGSHTTMPIVAKLDELGKPAWIALMILGFCIWWPLGLATLAFIMGSGRMTSSKGGDITRWYGSAAGTWWHPSPRPSGNRAFDEYRQETLRRLEEEQREFQEFLVRLRMAKDKAEFDQFMAERRSRANPSPPPQS